PSVEISGDSGPVNSAFTATITFTEDVTGFELSGISATNAVLSDFNTTSAQVYTALVTPSSNGSVLLDIAADVAVDSASNGNAVAAQYSVEFDGESPSVEIAGDSGPVNSAFTATITFSEDVTGFDLSDIVATNASLSDFNATSAQVYTVLATPSLNGSVTLDIAADVTTDSASNGNTVATQYSVEFDDIQPTVDIKGVSGPIMDEFTATITFSEDISGFALSNILVTGATVENLVAISSNKFTVHVTPRVHGLITLDIAVDSVIDNAGNGNIAASQYEVEFDAINPEVEITGASGVVNAGFTANINFSELVINFTSSDISVDNATLSNFIAHDGKSYSVFVTPILSGAVTVNIASNVTTDNAGNANKASNQYSVTYDNDIPLLISSNPESGDGNVAESINVSFTFNEDVAAVSGSDKRIQLFKQGDSVAVKSFIASGADVSVNSAKVNLVSAISLESGVAYTIRVSSGAFSDDLGNPTNAISINFTVNNSAPIANNDTAKVNENSSVTIDILANDSDENENLDSTSVVITSDVANGLTEIDAASGKVTYTPNENFVGTDSFSYKVSDLVGDYSNVAIVSITVENLNDAPIATDDSAQSNEDEAVIIDVLLNDTDIDGADDIDKSSIKIIETAKNSTVSVTNGKVSFTPRENFFGTDSFTYTVNDKAGLTSNTATVSVTISSVNDAPSFTSSANVNTQVLTQYTYKMLAEDVDGDSLEFNVIETPTWLEFDSVDTLSGTPSESELDQEFNVIVSVTDSIVEQVVTQSFTLTVNQVGETNLALSQVSSANPALVGTNIDLTYGITNTGPATAFLDQLTIELIGSSGVISAPESCAVEVIDTKDTITCSLPEELAIDEVIEFVLQIPINELGEGEVISNMSITQQSIDNVLTDSLTVFVSEEVEDENGDLLEPSSTAENAFGDLNNDGLADLVIVNRNNEANKILFNKGAGVFEPEQLFGEGSDSRAVVLADFNNDGFLDISVANAGQTVSGYYLNDGTGHFDSIIELGQMRSSSIAAADFNDDGLIDLVFGNGKDVGNKVFLQPFTLQQSYSAKNSVSELEVNDNNTDETFNATAVTTGDFNGDNLIDIAFGYESSALEIMFNTGSGAFNSEFFESISNVNMLEVADINLDGIDDIFISYASGNGVLFGGDSLGDLVMISNTAANDIGIADINADDILDILLVNNPGGITIYNLVENNTFERNGTVISTSDSDGLGLADIDGDGDIDIIITSEDSNVSDEVRFNQGNGDFGAQTVNLNVALSTLNTATVGDAYQSTLVMSNTGFVTANNVVINYTIANGTLVSIDESLLNCELASATQIKCTLTELKVDDEITVAVNVEATSVGQSEHQVSISSENVDDDLSNNHSSSQVTVNAVVEPPIVEPPTKKKSGGPINLIIMFMLLTFIYRRRQIR
ncbi:tandem-95 repeat protein, partial [Pseudoalteromonas sp. C2R02]|uniref:Ig-like domain-containing protein n=1 Tax=Pseudoalteromonas sp. C2R02 TaxID=2841565 RepID=UPI001C090A2E